MEHLDYSVAVEVNCIEVMNSRQNLLLLTILRAVYGMQSALQVGDLSRPEISDCLDIEMHMKLGVGKRID